MDPLIEELNLQEPAKGGAYILKGQHPEVVFTSGLRTREAQAHAMASNVVKNRQWIFETYVDTPMRLACQGWVDTHPEAVIVEDIAKGLVETLSQFSDAELKHLSYHLAGLAFDVEPVEGSDGEIEASIRALPGLNKFLDHEGGLCRWHAQFNQVIS